jgi:predicted NBD/HSP70 family sugar kinase
MQTLVHHGAATQAQLARMTGLSSATVSNIIRDMVDRGIVSTSPTTSSGRRALSVSLNAGETAAVGIDIGRRHVRVVLAGLGYHVLQEDWRPLPARHSAEVGLNVAVELFDKVLGQAGLSRSSVLGTGVGIPGPIDRRTGTVVEGAILPEWVGINILQQLQDRLGTPVHLDNDANLGALAQVTWGSFSATADLTFLKIGTGIGAGLIVNGRLHYGNVGVTGEVGHATIAEHGLVCRCGNRGCLETVASTSVLMEMLSRGLEAPLTTADIVQLALNRNNAALRVIDDAGLAIGRALANVCNLINPAVIVIGGPLTGLGDILLEPVRRGLARYTVPLIGQTTTVAMSSLGDRAEALGAAALVMRRSGMDVPPV